MSQLEDFFKTPSELFLEDCTKDQLLKIADHYEIVISDKRLKDTVKSILKANLQERKVLPGKPGSVVGDAPGSTSFTFEQQKELLLLQMAHDKMKCEAEQDRISLEREKLSLLREGRLSREDMQALGGERVSAHSRVPHFDLVGNLKLVPKFNEKDPETFFSLFERVADARGWPGADRTVMLQCVLTGKAQEAYAALSVTDSVSYKSVKEAVLKVYEMVPEAYRQRFREGRKEDKQSYLEFARELVITFNRWRTASSVGNFEELCDLVLLEQFKSSVPCPIATYITEQQSKTVGEAAALADQYALTHRSDWVKVPSGPREGAVGRGVWSVGSGMPEVNGANWRDVERVCHFCGKKGHVKADCYALKNRSKPMSVESAALSAPVVRVVPDQHSHRVCEKGPGDYLPFVSAGFVSLTRDSEKVPVKILRDTGALSSFILASVLPFSEQSDTGETALVRGMGLSVVSAPVHRLQLFSDLVQGEVCLAVRPAFPVEGVQLVLGNRLAGGHVWSDVPPSTVVGSPPR